MVVIVALRLTLSPAVRDSGRFVIFASLLLLFWPLVLALASAYDVRYIAEGFEQYRRVITAAIWLIALAGFVSFALHADVPREVIFVAVPATGALSIAGRFTLRKALHRRLRAEYVTHRVLATGLVRDVRRLAAHLRSADFAGFRIVGALTPDDGLGDELPRGVRWAGSDACEAISEARVLNADTIAVVAPHLMPEANTWSRRPTSTATGYPSPRR